MAVKVKEPKKPEDYEVCVVAEKGQDAHIASLFVDRGYRRTLSFTQADIVVFFGTKPVHPFIYGEHSLLDPKEYSVIRDKREIRLFKNLPDHVKKIGINRGALLLNILSGGRSFQQVDGHEQTHLIQSVDKTYNRGHDEKFYCNSEHQQLMIPPEDSFILAHASATTFKRTDRVEFQQDKIGEPEIVHHWHNNTLCCQYTPTNELSVARDFFFYAVENYLLM